MRTQFDKWRPLIYKMAYKWGPRYGIEDDEAVQLAFIAAWRALKTLDTDTDAGMQVNYLARSIQYGIASAAKVTKRHWDASKHVTIDTGLSETLSAPSTEEKQVAVIAVQSVIDRMPANTKKYALALIKFDLNASAAARYLGVTRQCVSLHYDKIRQIMREEFA